MAKANAYRVKGAYVTFTTTSDDGPVVLGRYQGAPLPGDVPQHEIDHLLKMGLIEETEAPAPPVRDAAAEAKADAERAAAEEAKAREQPAGPPPAIPPVRRGGKAG